MVVSAEPAATVTGRAVAGFGGECGEDDEGFEGDGYEVV